ncbi:hypothetical protein V6Z11_A07G075200 [Gossypium hirsutum]
MSLLLFLFFFYFILNLFDESKKIEGLPLRVRLRSPHLLRLNRSLSEDFGVEIGICGFNRFRTGFAHRQSPVTVTCGGWAEGSWFSRMNKERFSLAFFFFYFVKVAE